MVNIGRLILTQSGSKSLYLDDIYFSDFYIIDHFGKTKLGQLVYIGETSQGKDIVKEIVKNINKNIKVFGYSIIGSYKNFDIINEI